MPKVFHFLKIPSENAAKGSPDSQSLNFVGDTVTEIHIRIKHKAEELNDFGENKIFSILSG